MIDYECPKCGVAIASADALAGGTDTCPACRAVVSVPLPCDDSAEGAAPQDVDESQEVLWVGRPGWKAFILYYVGSALLVAASPVLARLNYWPAAGIAAGVAFLALAAAEIGRRCTQWRITRSMVSVREGWLSRHYTEIPSVQLLAVSMRQDILSRWIGIGTIHFSTLSSLTVTMGIKFSGVSEPELVHKIAIELMTRQGRVDEW